MSVSIEDRKAFFLQILQAQWPGRATLSADETAQAMEDVFGMTGSYEVVRRQIKAGEIVPGLRRRGGKWIIPILDLADAMAHRLAPEDSALPLPTPRHRHQSAKKSSGAPLPARGGRGGVRKIVPSTIGFQRLGNGGLALSARGDNEARSTWSYLPLPPNTIDPAETDANKLRSHQRIEKGLEFWSDVLTSFDRHEALARQAQTTSSRPETSSRTQRRPGRKRS